MATLTYDPTEFQEGEFTAEELEAIQVGEELAAHEESLLAGKYRDAEELEAAYIELQRKLGSRDPEDEVGAPVEYDEEVTEDEAPQYDSSLVDELYKEYNQGEFSQDTINAIQSMSPAEVADMFLERGPADDSISLSDQDISEFKSLVGGHDAYDTMISWAGDNLNDQEIGLFDSVMEDGNPQAIYFAIQALSYRYRDAQGYDGELLTGSAPTSGYTGFRSQAEVVRAMSDPRYDSDPAYRQDIFDKLDRSNLEF
jgi:hypothetical protein